MLKLNLLENGIDSIAHSIKHFAESESKHAILSLFQGIELILKESLRRKDPVLIYKDRKPEHESSRTVGFDVLITRLKEYGLISDDKIALLEVLRIERNKIQHYKLNLGKEDAEWMLGMALKYICGFSSDKLGVKIEDYVSGADWRKIEELVFSYEERVEKAKSRMDNDRPYGKVGSSYDELECPYCLNETILVDMNSKAGEAVCYLCLQKTAILECPSCGTRYAVMREDEAEKRGLPCDACFERY